MAINEKATVSVSINDEDASNKLKHLKTQADGLRDALVKAYSTGDKKSITALQKELSAVDKEIKSLQKNAVNVNETLKHLSTAAPKELQRTLKAINNELNSGRVKRGSQEWEEYNNKLRKVKAELSKINTESKEVNKGFSWGKLADSFNRYQTLGAGVVASLTGITLTAKKCVDAYAEMEEAESQVLKYTDLTKEEIVSMNEDFKKMDTRTPREQLNALAGYAGQLGVKGKQKIEDFVNAANKINVALGEDIGADAVKTIGRLAQMFGEDKTKGLQGAMLATGSAINELAQTVGADASYLVDFTARVGGVANQAHIAQADIIGYAGVLNKNMQAVEMSGTAVQTVLMKMYQSPAKFAKLAGKDVKEFTALLKKDANEAFLQFLGTLNKQGGLDKLAPMFQQMGLDGARASQVLSSLAGKIKDIREQQNIANKAYKEAVSIDNEFNVQNNTVQAGLEKAKNHFHDVAVELGEKLEPAMKHVITGTSMLIKSSLEIIRFVGEHKRTLITLTTAIGFYIIAQKLEYLWTSKLRDMHILTIAQRKLEALWDDILCAKHYLLSTASAVLHGNMQKARREFELFSRALHMSPWGVAAAAVATLALGFYYLHNRVSQATEAEKELKKVQEDAIKTKSEEIAKVEALFSIAKNENNSKKDRISAIQSLNKISPQYLGNLDLESIKTANAKNQLDEYITSLKESAIIKAEVARLGDIETSLKKYPNDPNKVLKVNTGIRGTAKFLWNWVTGGEVNPGQDEYNKLTQEKTLIEADLKKRKPKEVVQALGGDDGGGGTPDTSKELTESQLKKILEKKLKLIEANNDKEKIMNTALYAAGKISKEEYDHFMEDSDIKLINAKMKLYGRDSKEYNDLLLQKTQAKIKRNEEDKADDLKTIDKQIDEERNALIDSYLDEKVDKKAFDEAMHQLEYEALKKKRNLYMKGSKEYNDYQAQMDDWNHNDRLQKQQEFEQRLQQIKEYSEKKTSDELMTEEIAFWDDYYSKLEGKEKEHQEIIAAIRAHYNRQKGEQEVGFDGNAKKGAQRGQEIYNQAKGEVGNQDNPGKDSIWDTLFGNDAKLHSKVKEKMKSMEGQMGVSHQDILNGMAAADEDYYNQLAEKAEKAYQVVGGLMSAYSSYVSASRDVEVAKTTKNYDNQIKAAGENTTKGKKLEEQKQKEIAKIKNKYNKKSTNIQIAQAIAETAVSALRAYAAGWSMGAAGPVLAPIFAGIATATGMIQVAAIKKQAQAQDEGYYSGGFTPLDSNNRKPVGTVHANEFIANHQATGNPNLLPVLRLIDHAQRNNTVGSLTAQDVSNSLGGGTSSPISTGNSPVDAINVNFDAVAASMERNAEAIDKLQQQLKGGIESYVTIDGEHGFERQYNHYKKLQSNKSR